MQSRLKNMLNQGSGFWIGLALLIITIGAWFLFLEPRYKEAPGFFSILFGLMSWGLILAIRQAVFFENEKALDRAIKGEPPQDGEWSAVIGTILPSTQATLLSPFSGQTVLAYQYWVTYMGRKITGQGMKRARSGVRLLTAYTGFAIVPCEIHTPSGPVRINGMPTINKKGETLSGPDDYGRALSYISTTEFTETNRHTTSVPDGTSPEPGVFDCSYEMIREDRSENPNTDLKDCTLDETVILPGEHMCAYGRYSAEHRCLCAPDRISKGRLFTLVAGDASAALETLKSQRLFLYGVIFVLSAILCLAAWFA